MSAPTVETNCYTLFIRLFLPAMLSTVAVCISSCRQPTTIAHSWRRIVQSSAGQGPHRPSIHPAPLRYCKGSPGAAWEFWAAEQLDGQLPRVYGSEVPTKHEVPNSTQPFLVPLKWSNTHPDPVFFWSKRMTMVKNAAHRWEVWMYFSARKVTKYGREVSSPTKATYERFKIDAVISEVLFSVKPDFYKFLGQSSLLPSRVNLRFKGAQKWHHSNRQPHPDDQLPDSET